MQYVSISSIFKDVTATVELAVLSQLKDFDPNIQGVQFEHGHYLQISKVLQQKALGVESKFKKWPLIGLFRDFPETNQSGIYADTNIVLIIAKGSDPNWTSDQREANSFIPVLFPVFNALLEAIDNDGRFEMQSIYSLPYTKIDHYYWGTETKLDKTPNIFNEYTDAIELRIPNLRINLSNC